MAKLTTFITGLVRKPPMLLPLVGVAHVLALARTLWDCRDLNGPDVGWLQPLWMLGYTIFWLAACDLRRWGVFGYLALAILNTVIYVTATSTVHRVLYTSSLFLIDIIFCFFLILYYKRFR